MSYISYLRRIGGNGLKSDKGGDTMRELRKTIDELDDRIFELLVERHRLALRLGEVKREHGIPIYDPEREQSILDRLADRNDRRLNPAAILSIWREIFSASRQAQQPVRVGYLGPEGTFTQQAAMARFGASAELVPSNNIAASFAWVKNGAVDYAVLPVENTMHGIVGETVDLLGAAREPLIIGEIVLPIHFVFSSRADTLEAVTKVYSKNEAFLQCSDFLAQPNLAQAERVPVASTAEAARRAAADPAGAALSAEIAASQAGVPIRFHHVENNTHNKTRFLVLGHDQQTPTGNDKTSIFVKVPNVSGGLESLLRQFRELGINLTKIESRPMDAAANFETWFFIDMDGHTKDPGLSRVLDNPDLVWLGSYPRCQ